MIGSVTSKCYYMNLIYRKVFYFQKIYIRLLDNNRMVFCIILIINISQNLLLSRFLIILK
jgi:hypothetical protein